MLAYQQALHLCWVKQAVTECANKTSRGKSHLLSLPSHLCFLSHASLAWVLATRPNREHACNYTHDCCAMQMPQLLIRGYSLYCIINLFGTPSTTIQKNKKTLDWQSNFFWYGANFSIRVKRHVQQSDQLKIIVSWLSGSLQYLRNTWHSPLSVLLLEGWQSPIPAEEWMPHWMLFLKHLVELLSVLPNSGTAEDSANNNKHYSYIRKEDQATLKIVIQFRVVPKILAILWDRRSVRGKKSKCMHKMMSSIPHNKVNLYWCQMQCVEQEKVQVSYWFFLAWI